MVRQRHAEAGLLLPVRGRGIRGSEAPVAGSLVVAVLLLVVLPLAGLCGFGCASDAAAPPSRVEVGLLRVVDGDTIWVRMPDGTEEKVRYIGIDAPEVAHQGTRAEFLGEEASARNALLLGSDRLSLELDVEERDPYGRLLAYVWAGEVFVNERLVLDGYARAHDYPPNVSRQPQLREAERKAKAAQVGLWAPKSSTSDR
jgi:endonuclease YncB( thermonuclease family)